MTKQEKSEFTLMVMNIAEEALGKRKDPLVIALYVQELLDKIENFQRTYTPYETLKEGDV